VTQVPQRKRCTNKAVSTFCIGKSHMKRFINLDLAGNSRLVKSLCDLVGELWRFATLLGLLQEVSSWPSERQNGLPRIATDSLRSTGTKKSSIAPASPSLCCRMSPHDTLNFSKLRTCLGLSLQTTKFPSNTSCYTCHGDAWCQIASKNNGSLRSS
jgi:hypothetical protein